MVSKPICMRRINCIKSGRFVHNGLKNSWAHLHALINKSWQFILSKGIKRTKKKNSSNLSGFVHWLVHAYSYKVFLVGSRGAKVSSAWNISSSEFWFLRVQATLGNEGGMERHFLSVKPLYRARDFGQMRIVAFLQQMSRISRFFFTLKLKVIPPFRGLI